VAPKPNENLQLYISATSNVVSTMIVIERGESDANHKIQYLVYFVREVVSDSKTQYLNIMKLAYALRDGPPLKQGWSVQTRIITGCHYQSNDA
jgi:hypothetical protein